MSTSKPGFLLEKGRFRSNKEDEEMEEIDEEIDFIPDIKDIRIIGYKG